VPRDIVAEVDVKWFSDLADDHVARRLTETAAGPDPTRWR